MTIEYLQCPPLSCNNWLWGPPGPLYTWSGPLQSTTPARPEKLNGLLAYNVIYEGIVSSNEIPGIPINTDDGDITFDVIPLNGFYKPLSPNGISLHCEIEPLQQGNIPVPTVGQYVFMVGNYRLDTDGTGWAEIHPVRLLLFCNPVTDSTCTNLFPSLPTLTMNLSTTSINLGQGFTASGTTSPAQSGKIVWIEATNNNIDVMPWTQTTTDSSGNYTFNIPSTPVLNNTVLTRGTWYVRTVLSTIGSVSPYVTLTIN